MPELSSLWVCIRQERFNLSQDFFAARIGYSLKFKIYNRLILIFEISNRGIVAPYLL